MLRVVKALCLSAVLLAGIQSYRPAMACPMCKVALEDSEDPAVKARPKAYMYSILFMLSMPATLTVLFGVSFYRLSRRQQAMNAAILAEYAREFDTAGDDFSA